MKKKDRLRLKKQKEKDKQNQKPKRNYDWVLGTIIFILGLLFYFPYLSQIINNIKEKSEYENQIRIYNNYLNNYYKLFYDMEK